MSDFTEEQEAEIQKRIDEAKKLEQYKIAGLTGYKICLQHLAGLVDQYNEKGEMVRPGAIDAYVLTVMQSEFVNFRKEFFGKIGAEEKKADDE